ncbi:hypothetical protein TNCV_1047151 [Trichonephila clavipes]|nr:hypothetical protein TNCV_1047151 [Trichonephila clavipes]
MKSVQLYGHDCLVPAVNLGGGSKMKWATVPWSFAGPIINLKGRIIGDGISHDDIAPNHPTRPVKSCFDEHENESVQYGIGILHWRLSQNFPNISEKNGTIFINTTSGLASP